MTKEKLLELMKEERPSQKLLEVIDFRPSKSGIKGVKNLKIFKDV